MEQYYVYLPMTILFVLGLIVIIPRILKDRKEVDSNIQNFKYSNFWVRLLAFFIDLAILLVFNGIIAIILNLELKDKIFDFGFFAIFRHPVGILTGWLYFSIFESSSLMATLGKLIVRIKVKDYQGVRITFLRATGRYFGKYISSFLLCMGFLMIFFMKKKQALHDVFAGTIIIKN